MHPRSTLRPTQAQLVFPLLDLIAERGGAVHAIEAAGALADRFDLPDSVRTETVTTADGQVVDLWRRHVRFAREKAKAMGYVTSSKRGGKWELTDAGRRGVEAAQPAIVVEILTDADGRPRAARVDLCVGLPTTHLLAVGDARDLSFIDDGSLPLVVTSCPYFDLRDYGQDVGQLAELPSYEAFVDGMEAALREWLRVLMPGGRVALNVGDVLRSRSRHGEHHVLPLSADLLTRSTRLGYRALTGILWHKPTNCAFEQPGRGVLGTPGQPNGVIKAEVENILLLRKPGPYRKTTPEQRALSALSKDDYSHFFRPIWNDVPGARATGSHPAPFPVEIPRRLAAMFSFVGDTVLDPFAGSFTTSVGCAAVGRNSVGVDVSAAYVSAGLARLRRADLELAGVRPGRRPAA